MGRTQVWGPALPAHEGLLCPPPRGAANAGALTHGGGFNIGVEESNDYVDEDSQVEGNASPERHSAGEPVHQRHAWRERRQTHISANLVSAGEGSDLPDIQRAQLSAASGPGGTLASRFLRAIDKSSLLIS